MILSYKLVKYSLFGGVILQKFDYVDKNRHGTAEFPVEYYYVDRKHPRYHMAFHWHNEWELIRVKEGTLAVMLGDTQYTVGAGGLLLVAGETLHGGEPSDCVYECLVFDLYGLFKKNEAVKPYLRPFYRQDLTPDCVFGTEDGPPNALMDIFSQDSPCRELEAVSAVAGLFAWLIKEKRFDHTPTGARWSQRIKPVLEYIEAHYNEPLSLDTLASVAGMNSRYFCKVFYLLTNSTPINYLNFYRIEHAAYLIESTDLPITDIAAECGFWESSYFTKVFKKYKNTTPLKYRQDNKRRSSYEA